MPSGTTRKHQVFVPLLLGPRTRPQHRHRAPLAHKKHLAVRRHRGRVILVDPAPQPHAFHHIARLGIERCQNPPIVDHVDLEVVADLGVLPVRGTIEGILNLPDEVPADVRP